MTTILILAGDTDGNIGDRAIVYSTCAELRRQDAALKISLVSGRPEEDRDYFQAEAIPRGIRGLPRLFWRALNCDGVLCGGGGLFQDDASLIKMPYWAARLAAIRCLGARIYGFSLGVGPLDRQISKWSARLAFSTMSEVSVRDRRALRAAEPLTRKSVRLAPDPALLMPASSNHEAEKLLATINVPLGARPVIGIAARRWFHLRPTWIPHKLAAKYGLRRIPGQASSEKMCSLFAEVFDGLAAEQDAYILFLPTYNVAHEGDDQICADTLHRMKTPRKGLLRIGDPGLYKAVTGNLDVMVGSRMHPLIFAAAMGTPVIGLSYNQKFEGFFELIGREDQVLRIDDFVEQELTGELTDLVSKALASSLPPSPILTSLTRQTQMFLEQVLQRIHRQ